MKPRPALEFDPDRFLDERLKKYLVPNPFIFFPFNAGPRICLGQQVCHLYRFRLLLVLTLPCIVQFAYNGMSLFLVRLLQNFSYMTLDLAARPAEAYPPASWKGGEGRKGKDRIHPRFHFTMYCDVRP